MSNKYLGSCLCSEVNYEIAGDFESFYLCHCKHCQKDTGSAHAANLFSSNGRLKWLTGEKKVSIFELPFSRHGKSFCSVCGSALPMLQGGSLLVVPAGSLDSDTSIRPNAHIFNSSKASWDVALEEIPVFENFPV